MYEILNEDRLSHSSLQYLKDNFHILEFLSEKGVTMSVIRLSQLYYLGYACQQDKKKARTVLESIDYPDHPYYYYWAAKLLIDLYGKSESRSIEYHLRKSADMGYVVAQSTLASLFRDGSLLSEDPQQSFEYAKKAAQQGSITDTTTVGYYYMIGYGTSKSLKNAKFLLDISAKAGDKKAINLLGNF